MAEPLNKVYSFHSLIFQDLQQSVFNAEMIEEQGFDVNMVCLIKHISYGKEKRRQK